MSLLQHLFIPHESNNQRAKLLHPTGVGLVIGLFALFQIGLGYVAQRFPLVLGYASQISITDIINLTNTQRKDKGLAEVHLNPELSAAAAQKARDMFAHNYWAHVSPTGTQPWFWITESGYQYRYAGENLARDFANAPDIVKAWMNSPTHRDNLLNPKYQDIGVAVVDGKLNDHDTTLVVQMFGTKLSAVPAINPVAANFAVKAAEVEPVSTNLPIASPFGITRLVSLSLISLFIMVLVLDIIAVHQHKIVRWTSKSLAHLIFMGILLTAALLVSRGQTL